MPRVDDVCELHSVDEHDLPGLEPPEEALVVLDVRGQVFRSGRGLARLVHVVVGDAKLPEIQAVALLLPGVAAPTPAPAAATAAARGRGQNQRRDKGRKSA